MITIETNAAEVAKTLKLSAYQLRKAMEATSKEVGREALRNYRRTTNTWTHKPPFEVLTEIEGDTILTLIAGTDDPIYRYVDQGTRPHLIFPRRPGGTLAFRGLYTAKTFPGLLDSKRGGASGSLIYRPYVEHPGTEARMFSRLLRPVIQKFTMTTLRKRIEEWGKKKYAGM